VAAVFCSRCGRSNAAGSSFCQGCGAPLAAASGPTTGSPAFPAPGTAPGAWPAPTGPPPGSGLVEPTPQPQSRAADLRALQEAKTGALLGIIGVLLSVVGTAVGTFFGGLGFGISCNSTTGTCSYPSQGIGVLGGLFALDVVGFIIGILFILRFRSAFQTLVPYDYRFRSPASLSILAIVGLLLLLIGLGLTIAAAGAVISPCSSGNFTSCQNAVSNAFGLLIGGLGLIVLGVILLLIGGILLLIGIWRLGTRYNESLVKVGAILMIIPFLDIVGVFLVYFGVSQAERNLSAGAGVLGAVPGSPPLPPGAQ
jgi:hypothetical protein